MVPCNILKSLKVLLLSKETISTPHSVSILQLVRPIPVLETIHKERRSSHIFILNVRAKLWRDIVERNFVVNVSFLRAFLSHGSTVSNQINYRV